MRTEVKTQPAEYSRGDSTAKLLSEEVGVMFSGGLDSTTTALKLAPKFAKVHLLTYLMGSGLVFGGNAKKHAGELTAKFGNSSICHHLIDNRKLFFTLRKGFCSDYVEYCSKRAPFIYCMNCKLAMHARSIIYCIEHGIKYFADGSVEFQNDHAEMMPGVLKVIGSLYQNYGIDFFNPIYYCQTREKERKTLRENELSPGLGIGDFHKTVQPLCLPGILYGLWPYSAVPHEKDVLRFLEKKIPMVRNEINKEIKKPRS